jgi:hypothetical protein
MANKEATVYVLDISEGMGGGVLEQVQEVLFALLQDKVILETFQVNNKSDFDHFTL